MPKKDGPPKKSGRKKVKYIAVGPALWQEIKDFAEKDDRSVSWAARRLLRKALDAVREDEGQA